MWWDFKDFINYSYPYGLLQSTTKICLTKTQNSQLVSYTGIRTRLSPHQFSRRSPRIKISMQDKTDLEQQEKRNIARRSCSVSGQPIWLQNCRNIVLQGFQVLYFAFLAIIFNFKDSFIVRKQIYFTSFFFQFQVSKT